jgi:hypothetical protein
MQKLEVWVSKAQEELKYLTNDTVNSKKEDNL